MIKLDLNDRMDQLEKDIRKLEKEMQDCRFYQQDHEVEPERETPPFDTWSDEKQAEFFDVLSVGQSRYGGGKS